MNSHITPKSPSAPISYKSHLFSSLGTNNLCLFFFLPNLSIFLITITHKISFLEHFNSFLTGFVASTLITVNLFSPQWSPTFLALGSSFVEDNFSMDQGWGIVWGWLKSITFIVYFISVLSNQLHLRSSGIRSWKLEATQQPEWLFQY